MYKYARQMDAGKVAILGVMGALFAGVVVWIVYAMVKTTPSSSPPLGVIPRTYKKDVIIEQYSLLPNFINGQYEARFSAGAPHAVYPPDSSIKSEDTYLNDAFKVEIHPGMEINYYMTKVSDRSKIFSVNYTVPRDIHGIDKIWLCDGVIVDDRKFVRKFGYRFAGNWLPDICDAMTLAWSSPSVIEGVISDDAISCGSPPENFTVPYSFNSGGYSPETVKWKGAWAGMIWTLYAAFDGGHTELGSVTITAPDLHVLVGIADSPPSVKMSSS